MRWRKGIVMDFTTRDGWKVALGAMVGYWYMLEPMVRLLILMIIIDIVTGLVYAYISKTISSDASFRGMTKKTLMLLLTFVGHAIADHWNIGFDLGTAIATFYCVNEIISIIENCGKAGLPIPPPLADAVVKLKSFTSTPEPRAVEPVTIKKSDESRNF